MGIYHTTETKRICNELNARKSTGPKTEAGKARSRQNGVKHGLRAKLGYFDRLGESAEEILAFKDTYITRVKPRNPEELFLAEMMFKQHLNLRRLMRYEAGVTETLAKDCYERAVKSDVFYDDSAFDYRECNPTADSMLEGNVFMASVANGDPLEKIQRMEARILKTYQSAQDQLALMRRDGYYDDEKFLWPDPDDLLRRAKMALEQDDLRRNPPAPPAPAAPPAEPETATTEPTSVPESTLGHPGQYKEPLVPIDKFAPITGEMITAWYEKQKREQTPPETGEN